MSHYNLPSAFSQALRRLFQGAPNRRTRRALRRSRTYSRPRLECLEARVLLSSYLIQDLGTVAGGTGSHATAINAEGDVVGEVFLANGANHAALWVPGKPVQDLGTLGGGLSSATAINILGEVVGSAEDSHGVSQPFLLQPGGSMTNVNTLLPSSVALNDSIITANSISDTGFIVGQASFNLIDLTEISPYAFDPASGTINQLDNSLGRGVATAVAGTEVLAQPGNSSSAVENVNKPDSSVALPPPRPSLCCRCRHACHLRTQQFGDTIRNGGGGY